MHVPCNDQLLLVCRRVHYIVYSCVPRPDAKTARLQEVVQAAGGVWRDVEAVSEADLAAQVSSSRRRDKCRNLPAF